MGTPYGSQQVGSYTVDGATYKLYTGMRYNAANITGKNCDFPQVFAVRSSARTCGHISVSEHFKNWERNGIDLGGIYDCKIVCEAGGGRGSIEYTYATMSWDGQTGAAGGPAEPSEPQEPYDGAIAIPGTVEAENYDKGGNGFGYMDSDNTNEGGEYRKDGVDVVAVDGGYAVGYTTSSEWLTYTVNVAKAGKYDVEALASNGNTDIEIDLFIDDDKVGSLSGAGAGNEDWNTYVKLTGSVTLPAGEHILKVAFASDYNNLDYIKFYEEGTAPEEPSTPTTPSGPSASANGSFFSEDGAYFGPDCGTGAEANYKGSYYTGVYPTPFQTYLGKTDAEVQAKLDQLWNHYFEGGENSKVYYDRGNGEAYIYDTGNSDVRSEGMSYGMMICVQTNHREEFGKLWNFAKKYMWHNPNSGGDGYFTWKVKTDGSFNGDNGCAPDGEMYFMMSLLFAANRWDDAGYMKDAQDILKACWKGNGQSLFNEQYKVVTFQPSQGNNSFSDPSYDLPAFVDLFSRWSTTNNSTWKQAAQATRDHLYKSSNPSSGLFSDYNNFDGTPNYVDFNSNSHKYMYDAMRCAMNFGMDHYMFGADAERQEEMARRIIDFFEKDGYQHARFEWDGSNPAENYTLGETGANAVACLALVENSNYQEIVKKNFKKAWDASLMTGQYRYYDGLVHYLSMLHLCGSFKIWKPQPNIEKKTVEGVGEVTYLGETYTESTTITAFEDCQLYNVTIEVTSSTGVADAENAEGVTIAPNPANDYFVVSSDEEVASVEILNIAGQVVSVTEGETLINISLPAGTYIVKIATEEGNTYVKRLCVK
jgi:endo-1,4-beta-D-glucanase Y